MTCVQFYAAGAAKSPNVSCTQLPIHVAAVRVRTVVHVPRQVAPLLHVDVQLALRVPLVAAVRFIAVYAMLTKFFPTVPRYQTHSIMC